MVDKQMQIDVLEARKVFLQKQYALQIAMVEAQLAKLRPSEEE